MKITLALALWFFPVFAFSSGGFGGVSAIAKETSFDVYWNWNLNIYQPGSSSNFIKICYKKKNSIKIICKNPTVTSHAPAIISGLKSIPSIKLK